MATPLTKIRISGATLGVPSGSSFTTLKGEIWDYNMTARVGSIFSLFVNGVSGTTVPVGSGSNVLSAKYIWQTPSGFAPTGLTNGTKYWLFCYPVFGESATSTDCKVWGIDVSAGEWQYCEINASGLIGTLGGANAGTQTVNHLSNDLNAAGGNAVTKALTETVTIGTVTPTYTKGTHQSLTKALTETVTIGTVTPARGRGKLRTRTETITFSDTGQPTYKRNKLRTVPAETIAISDFLTFGKGVGGHKGIFRNLSETISLTGTPARTITFGAHQIVRTLSQQINISDALNYVGKVKHTGDPGYWLPLKARINIYQFTDTTYSSPIYTYNPFLESQGGIDKPVELHFESTTTTAGTFQIQIDNSNDTYDPDQFARGNRVTIDCSKDNNTWSGAYHGLVRSVREKVFGPNNRIILIEGYSYNIRLSERIIDTKMQARLNVGVFDRTDSTMFTDNLLNTLLTDDTKYINSVDDTQLYSIFKTANITASPIDDWIPRLDAEMSTLSEAVNSVLEFTQSLLEIDFSNDQLVLFNPDRPASGGSNAFLVTDAMNLNADSSLNTMYPIEDYTYQISYDFPDSANRLICAIGNIQCPEQLIQGRLIPGTVGVQIWDNDATPPPPVITICYDHWTTGPNPYAIGPSTVGNGNIPRLGEYILATTSTMYGKIVGQINIAISKLGHGQTGTVKVGIRKSTDVFVQFGLGDPPTFPGDLNLSVVPNDSTYHGYMFNLPNNAYVMGLGDVVSIESTDASNPGIFCGMESVSGHIGGTPSTYWPSPADGNWHEIYSLATGGGFYVTGQNYVTQYNLSNWGTIQLNGGTVQRVALLIGAGSTFVNYKLGRITLQLRTNGTHVTGNWWVGIRKADDTFIYFANGGNEIFDSITPEDATFRNYTFDNLNNNYPIQVGDRISIEGGLTGGYIEIQFTKDGGSPQQTQTYNGTSYVTTGITNFKLGGFIWTTTAEQLPDVRIDPCGGPPETVDADPIFMICSDRNTAKRIGAVEQVISNVPAHVKNITTFNEYMFGKIYQMAKPRFTFDYPSLTVGSVMPKAGDIAVHISQKAGVGVRRNPVQTGIITQVTYDFTQDSESILGLRKVSLTTTGILRGSY